MATSTFGKQFMIKKEKAEEFAKEMTQTASPTLNVDFNSALVYEKDYRTSLLRALK